MKQEMAGDGRRRFLRAILGRGGDGRAEGPAVCRARRDYRSSGGDTSIGRLHGRTAMLASNF